jgi:ABC-type antimicrobial peptide transport system permease subunit
MKSSLQLATLQLTRKKGRSLFLVLIMAIAVGVSSSLLRLLLQSQRGLQSLHPVADAVIGPKESTLDLLWEALTLQKSQSLAVPYNLFQTMKASQAPAFEDGSQTANLGNLVVVPALIVQKDPVWFGTDADFPKLGVGTLKGNWFHTDNEIVVGEKWAKEHDLDLNSTLEGPGGHYKIVGVLQTEERPWSETVFAPLQPLRSIAQKFNLLPKTIWNENVLDYFMVKNVPPDRVQSLNQLINERTVSQILWMQPEIAKLQEISGQSSQLFELMSLLIGLLAAVALSGIMISEIQNLQVQILTLRAIGYSKRALFNWMIWEGILISTISLILGLILDVLITPILQEAIASQLPVFRFNTLPFWASSPLWLLLWICVPLSLVVSMQQILKKSLSEALRK